MGKSGEKLRALRCVAVVACVGLIAATVATNLVWAVSFTSLLFRERTPSSAILQTALALDDDDEKMPALKWEEVAQAPVARLDGAAIQIGDSLFVFAGYATINEVHSHVDVFNLSNKTWGSRIAMPEQMAHSHLGMATDGRYIYAVSGQYGPQCRSPTAQNFVLDTQTYLWSQLLPLPVPRYAPATQLWRGRLHVMGGSKENRCDPALDHWSLGVHEGKALEAEWRKELPIPRGGPHRGQEGDFIAKPGSPIFKCSRQNEVVYGDVYLLEGGQNEWRVLPSMPIGNSHIEFAWVVVNHSIITMGGSTEKNPVTKRMVLVGDVLEFNTQTQAWRTLGRMPYRVKTTLAAYWEGWLYFTAGQRDKGPDDPSPKKIMGKTWRSKLSLPN